MPKLSWNETRDRALRFSREWSSATHEQRDKQTFWNEFFECFGIKRRSVAVFEEAIAKDRRRYSFLDLFWPGVLLVEHKSAGASFSRAQSQAFTYLQELARQNRHDEIPRYVVLCDFRKFALFDLEPSEGSDLPVLESGKPYRTIEFPLSELPQNVRAFAFIKGETPILLDPEDPANLRATQLLADLHDELEATGFKEHALERLLVRLLFCLFAEDTGIFEPGSFTAFVERTREDGSDLGMNLAQLFQILNTADEYRQTSLDEDLAAFPYVNGGLFSESLLIASFSSRHRNALIQCCRFHWARISPAVFGSLFQGIMDKVERRKIGAHYTSERDILKLLRSLFLDDLSAHLQTITRDRSTRRVERLKEFQKRLRSLRFLDPACGCGNFLILAYREIRRLENKTIVELSTNSGTVQRELDIRLLAQVDVDQFYGIEIGEWPARIAEVGLWLTDHQCNVELAESLGQTFRRLPLRASPTITIGNALQMEWRELLPPSESVLVFGNPPFVGHHHQSASQKCDQQLVLKDVQARGVLDYVCNWYVKAAQYFQPKQNRGPACVDAIESEQPSETTHGVRCAFVSTNSITQGEQASILWNHLFLKYKLKIHFAHRTFAWESEARGKAHVHVVIVGFGPFEMPNKRIYDYDGHNDTATGFSVTNISPYLTEGPDKAVSIRTKPLCEVPKMSWGNKPTDGGHLILSPAQRKELLKAEPQAETYVRRYMSGGDFINGEERYCLWLKDADPHTLKGCKRVLERVERVKDFRLKSKAPSTRIYANRAMLFRQIAQPKSDYLAVPEVSSERRTYIPIAYLSKDIICSNKIQFIPEATLWQFGMLTSAMHMAWMRQVGGRLKSDYSYSNSLVYNNFPWPTEVTDKQRKAVEQAAQAVLDARSKYPNATLAELYDPLTMPNDLTSAHDKLDRLVDRCYRSEAFKTERTRFEHLFAAWERLAAASPKKT